MGVDLPSEFQLGSAESHCESYHWAL